MRLRYPGLAPPSVPYVEFWVDFDAAASQSQHSLWACPPRSRIGGSIELGGCRHHNRTVCESDVGNMSGDDETATSQAHF